MSEKSEEKTIDHFKFYSVEALKIFLRTKGLNVSGNKETLVARAFAAHDFGIANIPDQETVVRENLKDYKDLLLVEGQALPDPYEELKSSDKWLTEGNGLKLWPPVYLQDISDYLSLHNHDLETASLRERLLRDYKDQKAYSFF